MNYISNTEKEKKEILSSIGVEEFSQLLANLPKESLLSKTSNGWLKNGMTEMEVLGSIKNLASKNKTMEDFPSFLGAGSYRHFIPAVVPALISRGEFLTAYTPYQPEASQGTLQATFEFQTMTAELYGMDIANASLYDGASALAEAALLAVRETGRKKILLSKTVHPEYKKTVHTYCQNMRVEEISFEDGATSAKELSQKCDQDTACVLLQSPNFFGILEEISAAAPIIREKGALVIVAANPISLGAVVPPGDTGADIAVGEGQVLGIPPCYGGPYLGLFACKEKYARKVPGRFVGLTKDLDGKRGFVLTLQTREQHIRREKATSNICTNEALMALAATVYCSVLGPQGLKEVSELNLINAHHACQKISQIPGYSLAFQQPFFNEFVIRSPMPSEKLRGLLWENKVIGGLPLTDVGPEFSHCTLFCVTEMNTQEELSQLVSVLEKIK